MEGARGQTTNASDIHPCRFVGDFVSFVEAGDVVDAGRLEVDAAVLARVDMSAEDESRALLDDGDRKSVV